MRVPVTTSDHMGVSFGIRGLMISTESSGDRASAIVEGCFDRRPKRMRNHALRWSRRRNRCAGQATGPVRGTSLSVDAACLRRRPRPGWFQRLPSSLAAGVSARGAPSGRSVDPVEEPSASASGLFVPVSTGSSVPASSGVDAWVPMAPPSVAGATIAAASVSRAGVAESVVNHRRNHELCHACVRLVADPQ